MKRNYYVDKLIMNKNIHTDPFCLIGWREWEGIRACAEVEDIGDAWKENQSIYFMFHVCKGIISNSYR